MTEKRRVYSIVAGMSSGTVSRIIGATDYRTIDNAHERAILKAASLSEEECTNIRTMRDVWNLVLSAQSGE